MAAPYRSPELVSGAGQEEAMPRVKDFNRLPEWLQQSLKTDWARVHGGNPPTHPPIRDPEYRVYEIGGGWWAVDAGTGGVTIESEGRSHAYVDLPEGSALKALVDEEGRACRETEHIDLLCTLINGNGGDPLGLGRMLGELHDDGADGSRKVRELAVALTAGLLHGNWPTP